MFNALSRVVSMPRTIQPFFTLAVAFILVACGGGGEKPTSETDRTAPQTVSYPSSEEDARRFLTQATFGPTDSDVSEVMSKGFEPWIDDQMALTRPMSHVAFIDAREIAIKEKNPSGVIGFNEFTQSFWAFALVGQDQLRQRVAFALSQIFVVSGADGCGGNIPRATANYYDMLVQNAFGSYRELLEKVSLHPIMGCYLSSLKNQRENSLTGRVPDENFAREIMQLFSIGLYQLNADGTKVKDANGNDVETYNSNDVAGLAKVFTGFSFDCPDWPSESCFYSGAKDGVKYADFWQRSMVGYPQFHSYSSDKTFVGKTIAASVRPNPEQDLKEALDWIALTHPNVGPFIGKQLIQRLVTSNPSKEYVKRVTLAFEASGRSMGAMIKAILLDPEARNFSYAKVDANNFGKAREPILKFSAFLRAMGAQSDSGSYLIDTTDDANTLSQTPLKAPTVFNFYRPGYVMPGGYSAEFGLLAPELQIANESSIAGYVSYMRNVIQSGTGRLQANLAGVTRYDVQMPYNLSSDNEWYVLASKTDSAGLIDDIDRKLMYGTMSASLKAEIETAVESIAFSAQPTASQIRNRLWSALLLTVASPEYQVQK
jgi:uncharacterized protein (DUF1800 family)